MEWEEVPYSGTWIRKIYSKKIKQILCGGLRLQVVYEYDKNHYNPLGRKYRLVFDWGTLSKEHARMFGDYSEVYFENIKTAKQHVDMFIKKLCKLSIFL